MDRLIIVLVIALGTLCNQIGCQQKPTCLLDVAFVLDGSGSVKIDNWKQMLDFVNTFASETEFASGGTRIAVISVGNAATLNVGLDQYDDLADFKKAVSAIPYKDENTNTSSGIYLASKSVFKADDVSDRLSVPDIMIVITDGVSTYDKHLTIPSANSARAKGIKIFAIGIGKINSEELAGIANDPDEYFTKILKHFSDLKKVVSSVVSSICVLEEVANDAIKAEIQPLSAKVIVDGCGRHDVTIILDSSGSIKATTFEKVKTFVKSLVGAMTLGSAGNQVAIVQYSTRAIMKLGLGKASSHAEVYDVLDKIKWMNSWTNTSGAIRMAHRDIFRSAHNRPDADDVIVLITDGASNVDAGLTLAEADKARAMGIQLFTLGMGNKTSMAELLGVANRPSFWFLHIFQDFHDLAQRGKKLINFLCATPYPPTVYESKCTGCSADIAIVLDLQPEMALQAEQFVSAIMNDDFWYSQQTLIYNTDVSSLGYEGNLLSEMRYLREDVVLDADTPAGLVAILVVSGNAWRDPEVKKEAIQLKSLGVRVLVIGVGGEEGGKSSVLASRPSETYYRHIGDTNDLLTPTVKNEMRRNVCAATTPPVWSCDFETRNDRLCGLKQKSATNLAWIAGKGKTPSGQTGPIGAMSGKSYIYLEASKRKPGEYATAVIPYAGHPGGPHCLSFYYNMHGEFQGSLDVIVRSAAVEDALYWRRTGPHGQGWRYGQVLLMLEANEMVGFRGILTGEYSGDTAMDAVTLRTGPCMGHTM